MKRKDQPKIEVRFLPEELKQIDKKLVDIDSDRQKVGESLWREWLSGGKCEAPLQPSIEAVSGRDAKYYQMLADVLASRFRRAIVENLQAFSEASRSEPGADAEMVAFAQRVKAAMGQTKSFEEFVLAEIHRTQPESGGIEGKGRRRARKTS